MKTTLRIGFLALLAAPVLAADPGAKDAVASAVQKLADQANYSWKTTVVVPEGSQFRPGPMEGKTEKNGLTHVTLSFGENTMQAVLKGEKAAMTTEDGWKSLAELEGSEGPSRFLGMMVRNLRTPAAQALDIAAGTQELKKEGEAYTSDLTEAGAKALLSFRPRGSGGEGPTISNAKGSARFWVKDGVLSKLEFKVQGKMTFNGNDREIDRTTTVEIKEVGTTKLDVPEEAKKKLS